MFKRFSLACVLFFSCGIPGHAQEVPEQPPQQFEGFNLRGYTQEGEKSWDVKGATANIVDQQIKLTDVDAQAYGDEQINLTAKFGTIDQVNGSMNLERDVVITSEGGAQLKTDSLNWKRDEDLVSTEDEVLLTDERLSAIGIGMEAHPNLKDAKLKKDVLLKIKTELKKVNGQIVTITCDGPLTIDQLKQQAVLNNNVVAVQDGRELKADRVEINFNQEASEIKDMICTGNVAITQGENTSYSNQAVYTNDSKKLILSGRPKIILMTEGESAIATTGN